MFFVVKIVESPLVTDHQSQTSVERKASSTSCTSTIKQNTSSGKLLIRKDSCGLLRQEVFHRPALALIEVEHLAGVSHETGHSRSCGCVWRRQIYARVLYVVVSVEGTINKGTIRKYAGKTSRQTRQHINNIRTKTAGQQNQVIHGGLHRRQK